MARPNVEAGLMTAMVALVGIAGGVGLDTLWPDRLKDGIGVTVSTRDVAPGDAVAVAVHAYGDGARIREVVAGFVGAPKQTQDHGRELGDGEQDVDLVVDVPPDADKGSVAELAIDADHVHVVVPVRVRAPGAATLRAAFDVGCAVAAWSAAAAIAAWAFGRRRRAAPATAKPTTRTHERAVVGGIGIAMIVLGGLGRLVFVWPILRTTTAHGLGFSSLLTVLWSLAIAIGALIGFRRAARTVAS